MRNARILIVALLLAGCGDVHDQRAPEDHAGYVEISRQLQGEERMAFGNWWNERSYRVKAGTATDADFNLTVGEAIKRARANSAARKQIESERQAQCGQHPCPIEPPADPQWTPLEGENTSTE